MPLSVWFLWYSCYYKLQTLLQSWCLLVCFQIICLHSYMWLFLYALSFCFVINTLLVTSSNNIENIFIYEESDAFYAGNVPHQFCHNSQLESTSRFLRHLSDLLKAACISPILQIAALEKRLFAFFKLLRICILTDGRNDLQVCQQMPLLNVRNG